jgi:hypothetical protein
VGLGVFGDDTYLLIDLIAVVCCYWI